MAAQAAPLVIIGASSILEGQITAAEALSMVDQTVLFGARSNLSKAADCLLLQSSEGDGAKTLIEGVLAAHHKSPDAAARERHRLHRRDLFSFVDVTRKTVDKTGDEGATA